MNRICPPPFYLYYCNITAGIFVSTAFISSIFFEKFTAPSLAFTNTHVDPIPGCKNFQACLRHNNFKKPKHVNNEKSNHLQYKDCGSPYTHFK